MERTPANMFSTTLFLIAKQSGPNQAKFLAKSLDHFYPRLDLDVLAQFDDPKEAKKLCEEGDKVIKVTVSADITEFCDPPEVITVKINEPVPDFDARAHAADVVKRLTGS